MYGSTELQIPDNPVQEAPVVVVDSQPICLHGTDVDGLGTLERDGTLKGVPPKVALARLHFSDMQRLVK